MLLLLGSEISKKRKNFILFPSCTARVQDIMFEIRMSHDEYHKTINYLCKYTNCMYNKYSGNCKNDINPVVLNNYNHIVFKLDNTMYVEFSDYSCLIGKSIDIKNW